MRSHMTGDGLCCVALGHGGKMPNSGLDQNDLAQDAHASTYNARLACLDKLTCNLNYKELQVIPQGHVE